MPLYPQSTDTLFSRTLGAQLVAVRDAGRVARIRYQVEGAEVMLERVEDGAVVVTPKEAVRSERMSRPRFGSR